jgi:predicted nuclease of restriction endonuclease-like (RecB) superfamily
MKDKVEILDGDRIIKTLPDDYAPVLETIVDKIREAQARAKKAVNFELVSVYREIGRIIHEKQSRSEWGTSVVEKLAKDLKNLFPQTKGLSSRNLWRMKDFYLSYCGKEKLTALLAEISWTHHLHILEKCKDSLEREFYIRMSKRNGWSYRTLLDHIENKTFERMIVEYALKDSNKPINVASYKIVQQLPQELRDQLPTPEQIDKLLEHIE